MEARLKLAWAFFLLFCLCSSGGDAATCSLKDMAVAQVDMAGDGYLVRYRVTVTNRCGDGCAQSELKLACRGFSSMERISRDIVSLDAGGELCTLIRGRPLAANTSVQFYYTAEHMYRFKPVSSTVSCP